MQIDSGQVQSKDKNKDAKEQSGDQQLIERDVSSIVDFIGHVILNKKDDFLIELKRDLVVHYNKPDFNSGQSELKNIINVFKFYEMSKVYFILMMSSRQLNSFEKKLFQPLNSNQCIEKVISGKKLSFYKFVSLLKNGEDLCKQTLNPIRTSFERILEKHAEFEKYLKDCDLSYLKDIQPSSF